MSSVFCRCLSDEQYFCGSNITIIVYEYEFGGAWCAFRVAKEPGKVTLTRVRRGAVSTSKWITHLLDEGVHR